MRSVAKQSPYFSAYPLKVLEEAATKAGDQHQSPYLKAVSSGATQTPTRIRISPMVNPYPDRYKSVKSLPLRPTSSKGKEPEGREWFNHYE